MIKKNSQVRFVKIFFVFVIFSIILVNASWLTDLFYGVSDTSDEKEKSEEKKPAITRTASTDTSCVDSECNMLIYPGIVYTYEDEEWKPIEEARSLKGSGINIIYLEEDENFNVNILDYNYTSITFEVNNLKEESLPISIWDKNNSVDNPKTFFSGKFEDNHIKRLEEIQDFSVQKTKILTYNFGFNKVLKIGNNSTLITYSTAGDGDVFAVDVDWDTTHDATTGYQAYPSLTYSYVGIAFAPYVIYRSFLPFNTTTLPPDATISSASVHIFVLEKGDGDNDVQSYIGLVLTDQPSVSTLTTSDYNNCGVVNNPFLLAEAVDITGISVDTWLSMPLNSAGIGNITAGGYTMFGLREGHDIEDSPNIGDNYIVYNTSESNSLGRPYLNITYSLDDEYPQFSNYWDNNNTIFTSGIALYNVTVESTNGTVLLNINGTNITATNISSNVYNASIFLTNGTYDYHWVSWGNGTNHNFNVSGDRSYTINPEYNLSITNPTTSSPLEVSSGDNITLTFDFLENLLNITSGIDVFNITIGGTPTDIITTQSCSGTLDCSVYSTEGSCNNCSQCNWTAGNPVSEPLTNIANTIFLDQFNQSSGNNAPDVGTAGTNTGGTWLTGLFGNAIYFGGDGDDIDSGTGMIDGVSGEYTIQMWIKPDDVSGTEVIWEEGGTVDGYWIYKIGDEIQCGFREDSANRLTTTTDSPLTAGGWIFITCTVNATHIDIYYNATLSISTAHGAGTRPDNPGDGSTFGDNDHTLPYDPGSTTDYAGYIDSTRALSVWRSSSDIATDYQSGAASVCEETGSCSLCPLGECDTNCSSAGCSSGTANQLWHESGNGWKINVTVPTFESGLKDLFINASYNGNYAWDNETQALNYGSVDTCTCTDSQNWEIDMGDYCILSDPCSPNDVTFTGSGNFTCNAELTVNSLGNPGANNVMYIGENCITWI